MTPPATLTLTAAAPFLYAAAATGDAEVRGTLVPYDQPGDTSAGRITVAPGAVRVPEDLAAVKLVTDHDRGRPVGYLTAAEDTPTALLGTFALPGDVPASVSAAAEVRHRLRDGLSVELVNVEWDTTGAHPRVVAADLAATGLVSVPAFPASRGALAASAPPPTPEPAPTVEEPTMTETTAAPADLTAAADTPAQVPPPPAAAGRVTAARTSPRDVVLDFASRVLAVRTDSGPDASARFVTAALSDITPGGNGAGNEGAGLGVQLAGELMDDAAPARYESCVVARTLTGARIDAWRWAVAPVVGPYAGDKAEIPTNAAKLEPVSVTPNRLAGGHDIDRIYRDLGSPAMLASYWRLMAQSVTEQIDGARLAAVQADAATGTAATTAAALLAGLAAVPGATYVILSEDLYAAEGAKPATEQAAIISGEGIYGAGLPPVIVAHGSGLTSTVIVGKRSARDFYTLNPPIRLEAANIAQAGIDAGVYGYYAALTVNGPGVWVGTVGGARSRG